MKKFKIAEKEFEELKRLFLVKEVTLYRDAETGQLYASQVSYENHETVNLQSLSEAELRLVMENLEQN